MTNSKINVLICDNTAENGVRMASKLRESGMYVYTRKKDGAVILDSICTEHPDVVVLDLTLKDTDAIVIMKEAKVRATKMPMFIVVSEIQNTFIERQVIENGASYFLTSPFEPETLCTVIKSVAGKSFSVNGCNDTESMVTEMMHKLGVPPHVKGSRYLITAIMDAIEDRDVMDCITKRLYPHVAEEHNTTSSRVQRAIRHAIDIAWQRGKWDINEPYFHLNSEYYNSRPTNAEFIALISDNLRLKIKNMER